MTPSSPESSKAVGPRLRKVLHVVLGLFTLLVINSLYLGSVTLAGPTYQNWFYLNMFLLHLVLGLLIIVPTLVFGWIHIRKTYKHQTRLTAKVGYALFALTLVLFVTGVLLVRFDFGTGLALDEGTARTWVYALHVACPLLVIWLFVVHRLTGPPIRWRVGVVWAGVALLFAGALLIWQRQDPRHWNQKGPDSTERYFFPSLARTTTGAFLPERTLTNDAYCKECHTEVHATWSQSAHRFSSFNNPVYSFSVKQTRAKMMARDGNVNGSRFCAGCHDPVPFFSGAFDEPRFDDPNYDLAADPMAQAGITCSVCHAISHVNSPRGNADYTIDEPIHYPFAFSEVPLLRWTNRQLIKAKPAFHKATFLKPLHRTPEFCGSCHKVHLPEALNNYKWLRGQNHYDSFWLSGVSGHGVSSFYYPPKAQTNCNGCHMPLLEVGPEPNFAAKVRDTSGRAKTLDHLFPSANTALPHLLRSSFPNPDQTIQRHRDFLQGIMRVDLFGIKPGGRIDDPLVAPLRPETVALQPGQTYLLEVVVRTLKLGHTFTEGTADSNEVWLEVHLEANGQQIGASGTMDQNGTVDPWSHFLTAFVLDREGRRIDRRNAEDIFVPLYNRQIPPGAADVVHYSFRVPEGVTGPITASVRLKYRKFDQTLMAHVTGNPHYNNDLPITVLAEDQVRLGIGTPLPAEAASAIPEWERWNDYGIGLLRKTRSGEKRQAATAFAQVEALGKAEGPINLARVWLEEGLVQTDAPAALARASAMGAPQWQLLWFGALVAQQNGDLPGAAARLEDLLAGGFSQAQGRGFDFSKDYRVTNQLGSVYYQLALTQEAEARSASAQRAQTLYTASLGYDPENLSAHWGLAQVYRLLGQQDLAQKHLQEHDRYRPDDNARDTAVAAARQRYPAANHAAEPIVIYDLQRQPEAP